MNKITFVGFPFEKMVLYQKSQEWADLAERLATRTRSSTSYGMVDQLLRAANSIPLNIAEGLGRWGINDRKRFFQIARGSVFECVPILSFFKRRQFITIEEYQAAYCLLDELGKMLTSMLKTNHREKAP